MDKTFGERLRLERERLKLTQEQFAALGGMSRLAQFKYEHGQHIPSVEYLEKLRQNAKVDTIYILTGKRLTPDQLDWEIAREAFVFVHKNFVGKPGKSYSPEQLFEVFRKLWQSMMDETYVETVLNADAAKKPAVAELG